MGGLPGGRGPAETAASWRRAASGTGTRSPAAALLGVQTQGRAGCKWHGVHMQTRRRGEHPPEGLKPCRSEWMYSDTSSSSVFSAVRSTNGLRDRWNCFSRSVCRPLPVRRAVTAAMAAVSTTGPRRHRVICRQRRRRDLAQAGWCLRPLPLNLGCPLRLKGVHRGRLEAEEEGLGKGRLCVWRGQAPNNGSIAGGTVSSAGRA